MSRSAFVVHLAAAPLRPACSSSSFCSRRALPVALRAATRYATLRRISASLQEPSAQADGTLPQNGVDVPQPDHQLETVDQTGLNPTEIQAAAAAAETEQPEAAPTEIQAAAAASEAAEPEPTPTQVEAAAAPEDAGADTDADADADAKPRLERRRRRRTRQKREVTLPLEQMTVGMELEGVVKSITDYGAFIGDTGAPTDGLLHVSQLGSGYVANVSDIVNVGDKVTVRVFNVDINRGNFSLTMKTAEQLESGESKKEAAANRRRELNRKWDAFTYDEKQFVDAKIISLTDFGAFCKFVDESGEPIQAPTDGLIHISEVSDARVTNVNDVLNEGQLVKVRVVGVDRKRNRISLSMREPKASSRAPASVSSEDIAEAEKNQPVFKTSFQLAFEKAEASKSQ